MSLAAAQPRLSALAPGRFAANHRWDRNFFLLVVVLIWLGILMGFIPQIQQHFATASAPYPLIVHFHAAAFVGWLLLLTTQVVLIRAHRADIHRRLGLAGAALAGLMIILGPTTALYVHAHTPPGVGKSPPFLVVQFIDIVAFAGLIIPALLLRGQSAAHKRLVLLATLFIADAGFSRWLNVPISAALGQGFWPQTAAQYLPTDLVVMGMGAYDLVTRGRLHPAYVAGVAWTATLQVLAMAVLLSAWWPPIANHLVGR